MSISNGAYHDLADYGDCEINQTGDNATMDLGIIRAYNSQYSVIKNKMQENGVSVELSPSVVLNQSGSETINMSGVDFTAEIGSSSELSSIKQSGSGSINLNGEYKGATFDVKQTGSDTINVNASMSLNEVTLTNENGEGGKLNVAKGATVSVNSITIDGGRIVNNGTINGVVSMALRSAGDTIHITDGELVNSGTINASINMTGGTLVAEAGSKIAGLTATGGDILVEGDITMTGDLVLDGDAELIFGDADSIIDLGDYEFVFNGSSIALTLGDKELEDVVLFTGAKENSYYNGYAEPAGTGSTGSPPPQKVKRVSLTFVFFPTASPNGRRWFFSRCSGESLRRGAKSGRMRRIRYGHHRISLRGRVSHHPHSHSTLYGGNFRIWSACPQLGSQGTDAGHLHESEGRL